MLSSFYSGISGLAAYGNAMSVIGNNIANMNTVGFKSSRVAFADLYNMALSHAAGGSLQVGRGVRMSSINRLFTQGSLETTGSATDMAIQGDGFFILSDRTGSGTYYTRSGHFIFDKDGDLVNPEGYAVQGWAIDPNTGIRTGALGPLSFSTAAVPASATQNVNVSVNLDSNATVDPGGGGAFDPTDPENTSNYSTSLSVYDSLGNSHVVTIYFYKAALGSWTWHACVDGSEITGGVPGQLEIEAQGTLTFDTAGALTADVTLASDFDFLGAAQDQNITFDFGTSVAEGGAGLDGTTQFAGTPSTYILTQDGYASGLLEGLILDTEGVLTGIFSNGQTQTLSQIALARFPSPWGLEGIGSNLFVESNQSGQPLINPPGTSGLGTIASNSLEMSNVDLAAEFVDMMRMQQAFTANSKVITTTDQMLAEVVNLKR